MSWVTNDEVRKVWKSAPADDDVLGLYLQAVEPGVIAYAPALPEGSAVPEHYKLALVMQARSVYNAGQARAGGSDFGSEDFSISIFPLDWQVKQLLRPIRGLGAIA